MTIFLCFLAALLEGADIVSMGLAAPSVGKAFQFGPGQMAYVLTAAIVGLMLGAAVGGRLGDRLGRKMVLLGAFVVLAVFSLLTAQARGLEDFILVRFLCGLGLGGAFPNLIAIAAEASPPERRATGVALMFCGQPMGGVLLALFVASQSPGFDWRTIFYIGGVGPLLLWPVLALGLPESMAYRRARDILQRGSDAARGPGAADALFGERRGLATLLLWASYGFTQVVVYLLNNWLPTLMVAKGFSVQQAGLVSAFENSGAVAGCVALAMIADRGRLRAVLVVSYAMIVVSLLALGAAEGLVPVLAAAVLTGFFAIGGQLVLYSMAPNYYPTLARATGVGAAVSFGRLGGIVGPMAAGKLLALGMAPAAVLASAIPCVLVAGLAAVALTWRPRADG